MLVDRYYLDAQTGRFEAERTVIRNGRTRRMNFVKRLFGFPDLHRAADARPVSAAQVTAIRRACGFQNSAELTRTGYRRKMARLGGGTRGPG